MMEDCLIRDILILISSMKIADAAKEYGQCHTLISTARTGYTDSKDSDYIDHIRNDVGYDMDVVQNVRDIKGPFIKIAVCDFDWN